MSAVWVIERCEYCHPSGHEVGCWVEAVCASEAVADASIANDTPDPAFTERNPDACLRKAEFDVITEASG